jgi:hypothetical protein
MLEMTMRARTMPEGALSPLIEAMGGPKVAAYKLRVSDRTIRYWRSGDLSLNGAHQLLGWAQHLGVSNAIAPLAEHIRAKERRHEAMGYIKSCMLFAFGKGFPVSQLSGWKPLLKAPLPPPLHLTDAEIAEANQWLARKRYMIVRGTTRLGLVGLI